MPPQQRQQGRQGQQGQQGQQDTAQPDKVPGLIFEQFQGINTATTRPGVPDQMAYWLNGFIPLQQRNLRTLPGVGPLFYTAPSGISIVCFYFYNLGADPFAVVFLSDGAIVQVATDTGDVTQIAPTGTIVAPSITTLGTSQFGQTYLIIVSTQPNGYWLWNGAALLTSGQVAPKVTITDGGHGYASPPFITASGGHGTGATFVATIGSGNVTGVTVTNGGSGYVIGDTIALSFSGGNFAGTGAVMVPNMVFNPPGFGAAIAPTFAVVQNYPGTGTTYRLTNLTLTAQGNSYSQHVSAVISGGTAVSNVTGSTAGWVGGPPGISLTISGGHISNITLIPNPAAGGDFLYFAPVSAPTLPTVSVTDNAGGTYFITSVTVVNGGSGYGPSVAVVTTGGAPIIHAALTPTVVSGVITAVTVNSGGGYGSASGPLLSTTDTIVNATATATIMPFGISGNCVETYQDRIWIFNGPNFNATAPGSIFDFAPSNGGVSQQSIASYLKVGYTRAISTNGFLFLIGDSSMDYISGVTLSGAGATLFTQSNTDPEQGTPFPASVTTLGSDIIMANSGGIWRSAGTAFQRVSEALDGVYNSVVNFDGAQLSSARATIFDKRVWMVLVPIIDPVTQIKSSHLLMWNGKEWWASEQDFPLSFISGQEINSIYTAWGTNGRSIFQLCARPSGAFTKTAQSRLWDMPAGYDYTKSIVNLFAMVQFYGVRNLNYTVTIDNETDLSNSYAGQAANVQWLDAMGQPVQWQNASGQNINWLVSGTINVLAPTASAQVGVLNGLTVTTQCDDMALISAMLQPEIVQYRA